MASAFDPSVLLSQISFGVRIQLDIRNSDLAYDATSLHFLVGNRRKMRKMIVAYNDGSDTYTVTVERTDRNLDRHVEAVVKEITVDRLNATLLDLYSKVAS